MQVLKFEDGPSSRPRKKKTSKFLLPAALLLSLGMFGSTFAANISINSGTSLEFGQGVLAAAACDSEISIAPVSSFANGASPTFNFSGVTISDLDQDACVGKTITLRAYGESSDTPLSIGSNAAGDFALSTIAFVWSTSSAPSVMDGLTASGHSTTGMTISFDDALSTSGAVFRMTIESSGS